MRRKSHVRFLGGGETAMSPRYPTGVVAGLVSHHGSIGTCDSSWHAPPCHPAGKPQADPTACAGKWRQAEVSWEVSGTGFEAVLCLESRAGRGKEVRSRYCVCFWPAPH